MKIKIIGIILVIWSVGVSQAQKLDYFIQSALENHLVIQQKTAELDALKFVKDQSSPWSDLSIDGGYNLAKNGMENWSISLMQSVSLSGVTRAEKQVAAEGENVSFWALKDVQKQVVVEVSELYYELAVVREEISLQEQNYQTYSELEKLAQNQVSSGKGKMVDVVRAQINKKESEAVRKVLLEKEQDLKERFNILLVRPSKADIEVDQIDLDNTFQGVDFANHPLMKGAEAKIKYVEAQTELAKKVGSPVLSFGVEYMNMNPMMDATKHEVMPMVGVSLPLFRKKYKARVKQSLSDRLAVEKEKDWLANQLEREHRKLQSDIKQKNIQVQFAKEKVEQLEEAKELLIGYYISNGESFDELMRIQQEVLSVKMDQLELKQQLLSLSLAWNYLFKEIEG